MPFKITNSTTSSLYGGFSITLLKNNLTQEQLTKFELNDRQVKAVLFVKEKGKITNKDGGFPPMANGGN
jgi:hypothetical protein